MGIVAAVLVPICGYCAVSQRSRSALWTFIIANTVLAILFIITLTVTTVRLRGEFVACACDAFCAEDFGFTPADSNAICENPTTFRVLYYSSVLLGCIMFFLQTSGAIIGLYLVRTKDFKEPHVQVDAMYIHQLSPPTAPVTGQYLGPSPYDYPVKNDHVYYVAGHAPGSDPNVPSKSTTSSAKLGGKQLGESAPPPMAAPSSTSTSSRNHPHLVPGVHVYDPNRNPYSNTGLHYYAHQAHLRPTSATGVRSPGYVTPIPDFSNDVTSMENAKGIRKDSKDKEDPEAPMLGRDDNGEESEEQETDAIDSKSKGNQKK